MNAMKTHEEGARRRAAASVAAFRANLSSDSLAAFRSTLERSGTPGFPSDDVDVESLRTLRHEIRREEGGGGMCHAVTEACLYERGWLRVAVAYLSDAGDVICSSHYVSVMEDGTIVDPTADQFGEGHDVRILGPDDPEYGRYRPEFYKDYNPGLEPRALSGWLPEWDGRMDTEIEAALVAERGEGWWLDDTAALIAYLDQQVGYAAARNDDYVRYAQNRLDALSERSAGLRP